MASFVNALILGCTLLAAGPALAGRATNYDLRADWSNDSNPNGPWLLQQGITALPSDADWTPISTQFAEYNPPSGHIAQPAWAPGNASGAFLPGWFKSTVSVSSGSADWHKNDVVLHTTDGFNGIGNGPASVVWTSPSAGTAVISGKLWNARNIGRNQSWQVLVNGSVMASGNLPGDGSVTRKTPAKFKLRRVALSSGSTVQLLITEASSSGAGDLVGNDLAVKLTP